MSLRHRQGRPRVRASKKASGSATNLTPGASQGPRSRFQIYRWFSIRRSGTLPTHTYANLLVLRTKLKMQDEARKKAARPQTQTHHSGIVISLDLMVADLTVTFSASTSKCAPRVGNGHGRSVEAPAGLTTQAHPSFNRPPTPQTPTPAGKGKAKAKKQSNVGTRS